MLEPLQRVAAARVEDIPPGVVLPGAIEHPCVRCGKAVVVTPASDRMIAGGVEPWCLTCALDEDPGAIGVMTDEQKQETRDMGIEPPEGIVPLPRP